MDKQTSKIICTYSGNGKKHDFKLFKESKVRWTAERIGIADTGYTGLKRLQANSRLPKKRSKKKALSKEEKKQNQAISSEMALNENVIGRIKRFKILSDRYRNRRKRFGLRLNLISGIYNFELKT